MRVRKFRPEDARACSRIIIRNFRTVISKEDPAPTIRNLIKDSNPKAIINKSKKRKYFVAVEKEEILGIGGYDSEGIHTFFVNTRLHGKGIGKAILARVLADAKKTGMRVMMCNSSLCAERFYASSGFRRIGKKTVPFNGSKITFIEMKKLL